MTSRERLVSFVVILYSCCFAPIVLAKQRSVVPSSAANQTHVGNDGRFSWISYTFRSPPSLADVEVDLETRWRQLEEDITIQRAKFATQVQDASREAQEKMQQLEHRVDKKRKELKRKIEADLFKQRHGWERFRKSVRAQVGIVMGTTLTFAGSAWTQTSSGVQAARLTWGAIHKSNVTRGLHDPWLTDATAGVLAFTMVAQASGKKIENATLQRAVPLLTIGMSIAQSVGIIMDNYEDDIRPMTRMTIEAVVATVGTAVLSLLPIPLTMVAASVAGASLLYQSVIAEVVGNWFYLLERATKKLETMDREKRRKIEQGIVSQLSKALRQKLLYPVHAAYDEVYAALHNETTAAAGLKLEDKIHQAIQHSMQVKLVWGCATVGIVVQLLWRTRLVDRIVSTIRSTFSSWRTHGERQKPMAGKPVDGKGT